MQAFLICGLGFGDEGKGGVVDHLTRLHSASLVVRSSGGCQCSHTVVEPSGRHHCFAQFGSGTLAGAATHLGPQMLVEPFALLREADVLHEKGIPDPLANLTIDPDCVITTPYHQKANQLREVLRGDKPDGTCGRGIGETRSDELSGLALRIRDLNTPEAASILATIKRRKMRELSCADHHPAYAEMRALEPAHLAATYACLRQELCSRRFSDILPSHRGSIIFEGNQGILLDERHGFQPHTTWTDCTFAPAETMLAETSIPIMKIGVLRAYATRHGVGPFPSEDSSMSFNEPHNNSTGPQGAFRQGHFDAVLARHALACIGGVDEIAITHVDRFFDLDFTWVESPADLLARRLPVKSTRGKDCVRVIEDLLDYPVTYISTGPTYQDKARIRRAVSA